MSRQQRRRRRLVRVLVRGVGALLLRGVFALVPLVLLACVLEVGVRVLGPEPEAGLFEGEDGVLLAAHPSRMWALRPGTGHAFDVTFEIAQDGLRASAAGAGARVLTVGDSSIFGHGVTEADTLHRQLQAALERRGVQSWVRTAGVPGYSTEQTRLLMDEVGWSLDPDLLVIGNLWSDNNVDGFVDAEWLAQLRTPAQRVENALSASRLWTTLRPAPVEHNLRVGWIRDPDLEGRRRVPLEDYARNLDELVAEAARRGVGAVFLAPCNAFLLSDGRSAQWDPYFEAMRGVAAHRGVLLVEGRTVLEQAGLSAERAFLDEMHPSGASNAAYAEALAEVLVDAGWPVEPLSGDVTVPAFHNDIEDTWWR